MRQPSVLKPLTRQQRRVSSLAAEGLQNKEIGARLHLTTGTVKQYMFEIFNRTGCQNRTELTLAVLRSCVYDGNALTRCTPEANPSGQAAQVEVRCPG